MSSINLFDPTTNRVDRPVRVGTVLPVHCRMGEIFFLVSNTGQNKIYASFFLDTWTEILSSGNQVYKSVSTITAAQLKTLTTIVSAEVMPGVAGKVIVPATCLITFNPVTTPYTVDDPDSVFFLNWANYTSPTGTQSFTQFYGAANLTATTRRDTFFAFGNAGSNPSAVGQGIVVCKDNDVPVTLGDGTITITIFYYLV